MFKINCSVNFQNYSCFETKKVESMFLLYEAIVSQVLFRNLTAEELIYFLSNNFFNEKLNINPADSKNIENLVKNCHDLKKEFWKIFLKYNEDNLKLTYDALCKQYVKIQAEISKINELVLQIYKNKIIKDTKTLNNVLVPNKSQVEEANFQRNIENSNEVQLVNKAIKTAQKPDPLTGYKFPGYKKFLDIVELCNPQLNDKINKRKRFILFVDKKYGNIINFISLICFFSIVLLTFHYV